MTWVRQDLAVVHVERRHGRPLYTLLSQLSGAGSHGRPIRSSGMIPGLVYVLRRAKAGQGL